MKFSWYILSVWVISICFIGGSHAQTPIINRIDLEGQLAYIGSDFNVYTMNLSDSEINQLSTDGSRRTRYEFPSWSIDGQLAYFCCSVRGNEPPRLSIYVSSDGVSEGQEFYNRTGERHVYSYWSPTTCIQDDCVDLAVLVQNFTQPLLRVDLFNSQSNTITSQRGLGEGTPFYFSWSPTGESMVIHRNNSSLQYYSVSNNATSVAFEDTLGSFLSPDWSPIDDRILFSSLSSNQQSQLVIGQGGNVETISDEFNGIFSFSWAPNGKYIAYRYITQDTVSPVYVVDTDYGEIISQSNVSSVFAFFWSPNSEQIAYITLANPPGSFDIDNNLGGDTTYLMQTGDGLAWNILDVESNSNTLLDSFIPTIEMQYLLTNFDQFAQSHSIWSPDSEYIVYSEINDLDSPDPSITILSTRNDNLDKIQVADGVFAVWSYR